MHNKGYCKKLKLAREKLGITQYELANRLRVSASSIGMYEQNPIATHLPKYAML